MPFILFLLLLLPSNAILLLLLNFNLNRRLGNFATFIYSYGTGPMLVSFVFYCLIIFFPERSDFFYASVLFGFLLSPFVIFCKKIEKNYLFHKHIAINAVDNIKACSKKIFFFGGIIFFILTTYSVQALFLPIVDNDSVLYTNQAKAFYKFKDIQWRNESSVTINVNDKYNYNSSIQPALPIFLAASFLLSKNTGEYFPFQFLFFYYFLLLLASFLYLIYFSNNEKSRALFRSICYGIVFFIFSSALTRILTYNAKESAIYFFGLFSLVLLLKLLQSRNEKDSVLLGLLLGLALGINSFINLHGVAIALFILITILIFFGRTLKEKIGIACLVLASSFLFGYAQLIFAWKFFIATSEKIFSELLNKYFGENNSNELAKTVTNGTGEVKTSLSNFDVSHKTVYQMNSLKDMYIKGKLQILTNIGYFGFYLWFLILALFNSFGKVIKNDKIRTILFFMGLYFFVMMDPLNLNETKYAIILWGSSKYAVFLLLLGLVPLSMYTEDIIEKLTSFFKRFGIFIFPLLIITSATSLIFLNQLCPFFLKILFSTIPIYKEISFYENLMQGFLLSELITVFIFSVLGLIVMFRFSDKSRYLVMAALFFLFILMPFLTTSVGKVPLSKTFAYLGKNEQEKLKKITYEKGIFELFSYAQGILPKNTEIITDFNEVYSYNDYFSLTKEKYKNNAEYKITKECGNWKILYQTKGIRLCSKN